MKRFGWIVGLLGLCCLITLIFWKKLFGEWDAIAWSVAGVGVALVALYSWLDRERIEYAAGSRAVRFGSGAFLLVLVGLGLGVTVNILAYRYDHRWDATSDKQHTLSEQSKKIASTLEREVQVLAFFQTGSPDELAFKRLVEGYQELSDKIKPEYHDPWREPLLTRQHEVTSQYGTVILVSGQDKKRLESKFDEEAFTNALVQVVSGREHRVCFTEDHGEANPDDDQEPTGLGFVVLKLEAQNYQVDKISLIKEGGVPGRCEVLVVAGPQVDLLPVERELVAKYLKGGGRVLMLLDPLKAEATAADLSRYGLKLASDVVLEDNPQAQMYGLGRGSILVPPEQLDFHPITSQLKAGLWFYLARSVAKMDAAPQGLDIQVLAKSSAQSWGETRLENESEEPKPDAGQDIVGSVPIMAMVEVSDPEAVHVGDMNLQVTSQGVAPLGLDQPQEEKLGLEPATQGFKSGKGRLVVVGDSDFASNQLVVQLMNQDLFLNTIAWLSGEENQISIRANKASESKIEMTVPQGALMWLLCLLVVPGIAVGFAIAMWARRRSL